MNAEPKFERVDEESLRAVWLERIKRMLFISSGLVAILGSLFVWNGSSGRWQTPEMRVRAPALTPVSSELRVLAFNIAKASFHRGGLQFASVEQVHARLDEIAGLINREHAHVVLLSEVVWASVIQSVNQVVYLAEKTDMHAYAYGDNYRFGIPNFEVRSGNAILSRYPLESPRVQDLPGESNFYNPTGKRRVLWADLVLDDRIVSTASVRNDSFDLLKNHVQSKLILSQIENPLTLLGGDFNAEPEDASMGEFSNSGHFLVLGERSATFPADEPRRRIDYILAPKQWEQVEYRTIESDLSDHLPVLAVYRLAE